MNANQLQWGLRQELRRSGVLGLAGLALAGFAGLVYMQDVKPFERDLADREVALERNIDDLKRATVALQTVEPTSKLNTPDSFTTFLRDTEKMAGQNRIGILQSEYRVTNEAENALTRYGVLFPANGRYPDVRSFIVAIEQQPGVRVEAINLSRLQIADELLTVQLQLSYLTEERQ
ncbi:hypothetical protein ACTSKR_05810 [Chitinibacteraceae bacterium HSL-7]